MNVAIDQQIAGVVLTWCLVNWQALLLVALYLAGFLAMVRPWRRRPRVVCEGRQMQVECSWCGSVMTAGRQPVSHGICPPCLAEELEKIEGEEAEKEKLQRN
jgi:hypothetical protein